MSRLVVWLTCFAMGLAACGEVSGPQQPMPDDPWVEIAPSDPRIQYTGRLDLSGTAPRFSYPGVSIRIRFKGESVDLRMRDHGAGGERATNYYNVLIDGRAPVKLEVRSDTTLYELARGLGAGEHVLELYKRTESEVGHSELLGLRLKGELLEPLPRPARRLEIIGDSVVCGYGNEVSIPEPPEGDPNTGFHSTNQNFYTSYGALAARALKAELVATCYSGRGMYRNNNETTDETLPLIYDRLFPQSPTPQWDTRRYVPDVVLINLGTNDFSPESYGSQLDSAAFKEAYTNFVTRLRQYYPQATIVCSVGPLLSDYFPQGLQQWTRIQQYVSEVVEGLQAQGDLQVHYQALSPMSAPYGEDYHPDNAAHAQAAAETVTFLRSLTDW